MEVTKFDGKGFDEIDKQLSKKQNEEKDIMINDFFTIEEAQAKVGKTVEAVLPISHAPAGCRGLIAETDQASEDGYYVVVEWQQPNNRRVAQVNLGAGERMTVITGAQPFRDYIRRDEYKKYLHEV